MPSSPKMDSSEASDDEKCLSEAILDRLLSCYPHQETNSEGLQPKSPRVGSEFQADLPFYKEETCNFQLCQGTVKYMEDETEEILGTEVGCKYSKPTLLSNNWSYKVNENAVSTIENNTSVPIPTACTSGFPDDTPYNGSTLFPDLESDAWTQADIQSFILGLYIFRKDFYNIVKFMGNKKVGSVVSFYHGHFYKSDAHRTWSGCKKVEKADRRRSILGQQILSGWRQQELLKRLLPNVSENDQETLKKVSKSFSEDTITLEEYVFVLKSIVGLEALVEAVGIGKGKQDLTSSTLNPNKTNKVLSMRSVALKGKKFSSLTAEGIITYLTGDLRLSKTLSTDLFWEAVWPRLLERGWHSEQPKSLNYATEKNALVFLTPGVKKFSRSKLVKGKQYFDSFVDVLKKVASEPSLLKLEFEGNQGGISIQEKKDGITKTESDGNSVSCEDGLSACPSLRCCTPDIIKCTVVDTSMEQGEVKALKEGKLRNLFSVKSKTCNYVQPNPMDSTDNKSSQEVDSSNTSAKRMFNLDISKKKRLRVSENYVQNGKGITGLDGAYGFKISKRKALGDLDLHVEERKTLDRYTLKDGKGPSQMQKSCKKMYFSPVSKQRRLSACMNSESTNCNYSFSKRDNLEIEASYQQKCPKVQKFAKPDRHDCETSKGSVGKDSLTNGGDISPDGEVGSSSATKESSDDKSQEKSLINQNIIKELSDGKSQESALIDLNTTPCSPIFGHPETCSVEMNNQNDNQPILIEKPQNVGSRRQSTRNRPPTTRVLEAFAMGYLSPRQRERSSRVVAPVVSNS